MPRSAPPEPHVSDVLSDSRPTVAVLPAATWREIAAAHAERADALMAGHRARKLTGEAHAIEDFLYTYYATRPGQLRRWHPGSAVDLVGTGDDVDERRGWRWYAADGDVTRVDVTTFLAERGTTVSFVRDLVARTTSRPANVGCFGLHEWAMVYGQAADTRHPLPLRLGAAGTDDVVERHQIRCSHIDAFRFFTPAAVPLNRLTPTRANQVELEQPGCLHASMDLYKWAMKLGPVVESSLVLDCFELALDVRYLDMQASPYDVSSYGLEAVAIETADGKAEYSARQREFAERAAPLRTRLVAACDLALALAVA
ncbi:3-methyladenine DNA glycosylase [Sanguibacter sp. A247]|uniref:3-methyladenine DNA glycosylase n=1 Tax=unclassified Sanguibacter TaxID=2645534 RepID=UPI003FD8F2A5